MEKADCLKHRKSSVVIAVQRPDGSPVSKREVEIRQTGHSFLFGCGAFETLNITDSDSGPEKRAFYEERSFLTMRRCRFIGGSLKHQKAIRIRKL